MIDPQLIGKMLLKDGFRVFFLYLFKIIEGRPFIEEPLHTKLFQYFQDIYDGKITRATINIAPRSAKTTLSTYFVVFAFTNNPKSQIIYTSYSQQLLADISAKVASILEHPVYKALYPQGDITLEDESINPVDDFWRDYLMENTGRNIYTSKVIKTFAGGICLFTSMGSAITGFGAGLRNSKRFSGFLIMDDPQKPADIRSQLMREKTVRYYEETLLSRLNNPDTPIMAVMQRLHIEDLSGVLINKYHFECLKIPLLDDEGNCLIPSQYTKERIEELKHNNYMFSAQYMQQPIIQGGQVIKRDWFRYYPASQYFKYKRILIAADTAMKVKEYNDYSVFIAGGVTEENHLHVLDMVRGKWEAPDLEKQAVLFWNRFKRDEKTGLACNGLYVEDKASGVGLIQSLKAKYGIPVIGITADKDKLTRAENVLPYIESGQVYLPENEYYGFVPDLLTECEAFSRDMSQVHDDIVDALGYLIQQALGKTEVSILDYFM